MRGFALRGFAMRGFALRVGHVRQVSITRPEVLR